MKQGTITRSTSRTAQRSRSSRGTYVKPPRMRQSVFVVKQALRGLAALTAFQLATPLAFAGAQIEGTVRYGDVNITQASPTTTNVNQGSSKAIMDLTVLNVPKDNTLNFNQPGKDAVFLGRGVGNDPFRIYGTVNANGQVFLVNPQGVIFAPGASVNVGGLVASTNDIRNEDFVAGKYVFQGNGGQGAVINAGRIETPSGYAALIGPKVSNEGTIIARTVALAAGNRVALDMIGDGLISVRVEEAALGAAALNKGTILAEGGSVYMLARSADALLDTVVNNTGIIRATSLVERNGTIILDGGSAGVVANSGTLDVSGKEPGATGGTVKVLGEYVGLFNGSRIDASGDAGGGTVLVGGNFHGFGPEQNAKETYVATDTVINADAINSGNGGQVAIWSNNGTEFYGSVSARGGAQSGDGGFVEISGKDSLVFAGSVDTRAPNGRAGSLLLDPADIFIIDGNAGDGAQDATLANATTPPNTIAFGDLDVGANTVTVGQLQAQGNTSITLQATNTIRVGTADGTTAANVDLSTSLTSSANTLTLAAGNGSGGAGNVTFNTGSVITTGGGSVAIHAGQTGDTTGNAVLGAVTTNGGTITVTAQGSVSLVEAQNASSGNVVITAQNGSITGTGLVTGNNVTLDSATGVGTSTSDRVNTAAQVLAARARVSGGVFLQQANAVSLATINGVTNSAAGGGYNITSGGAITVNNGINTGNTGGATTLTTTAGGIAIGGNDVGNAASATTLVSAANITGTTGVVHGTDVTLDSATGVGTDTNNRLHTDATTLAARSTTSGGVFIAEANDISLATIGGVANSTAAGGAYHLSAGGGITVDAGGVTTANGQIQLVASSITNNDTITNGGGANTSNILLRADTFNLHGNVASTVEAGGGAVIITPNTVTRSLGIEAADQQTNITNADLDTIHTTNFVVLGSSNQGFTGNTVIGRDAQVDGGTKSLAFFRVAPGTSTTTIGLHGVTTTGDVFIAGGGNIVSEGGTVKGDHVALAAGTGIGANTPTGRVLTDANVLAINTVANGAFVTEADNVSLATISRSVGGTPNTFTNATGNGTYNFVANGAISIDSNITTNNGIINITGDSITNHAAVSNALTATSNIILAADAFSLGNLGASINSHGGATFLRPRTPTKSMGIEAAGDVTLTNADIATISTTNFLGFGAGSGAPGAFTGDMAIGVNNTVNGGTKNLTFLRDPAAVATTTIGAQGVTTSGDVIISAGAGNIVSQGGTISGNQIELRAGTGIGTALDRVHTSANRLAVQNQSGGAFVTEADGVTLADINQVAGGTPSNATNTGGTGAYDVVAGGTITVGGAINTAGTGSTRLETTAGDITIGTNSVGNLAAATTLVSAGNITGTTGVVQGTAVTLDSATGVGTDTNNRLNTAAITLAARTTASGGVFIAEANDVSLATIGGVANSAATGGAYHLSAGGGITVDTGGVTTANGQIQLVASSITNNDTITNGGGANSANILLRADTFNLHGNVASTVEAGGGAVIITPNTVTRSLGIEAATQQTNITNADLDTIHTTNFVVLGSAVQGFTGNTIIGQDALVDGGTKSLAFFRVGPGSTTIGAQGVTTTGDVIVNAGGGSLIGSPTGSVGGNHVQLVAINGIGTSLTPVRTSANVLAVNNNGGNGAGAFVSEANDVSLADVSLTVGGNVNNFVNSGGFSSYTVTAGGAISVDNAISTTNATITLDAATSLTNNSTITNGGGTSTANIVLRANAYDLDGTGGTGQVQAGAAAVVLTPHTNTNSLGVESAGDTTVAQSDLDAIHTTNFVALGSANLGFTGNTTIGQNALVNGNGKSLAFLHANGSASTTTIGAQGLTTTGDVIVNAANGSIVSNGGTITGNRVQLVAGAGIGTSGARIKTAANTLAASNGNVAGGVFISEADAVSLAAFTLTIGGNTTALISNVGGPAGYDLTAAGTITVGNLGVNSASLLTGPTTLTTTGAGHNIEIAGGNIGNAVSATNLTSGGSIINVGAGGTVRGTNVTLDSATGVGTALSRVQTDATNNLAARSTTSGGVFVGEIGQVTLATIGTVANTAAAGAAYDVQAGGTITVGTGGVNTAGTGSTTLTAVGPGVNISIGANDVGNAASATTLFAGGSITGTTGVVHGTAVTLDSGTGIGTDANNRLNTAADTLAARTVTGGGVFINEADGVSLATIGGVSNSTAAGGAYDLLANGAITVDAGGVTTANGLITLNGTSLTNNATISNGGGANTANIVLRADAFDLDGAGAGQVQGGNAAVIVTPRTNTNSLGIVSAGDTTVAQSDLDAIHTTNFVVLGSANLGFTGNTTIGQNALVNGNGKSLAFFHALGPSTTTIGAQGVSTTGDIAITSGNIVSNGGTITGNQVQLVANTGIGTSVDRVKTSANTLAAHNNGAGGSGVFVSEQNDVTLAAFTLNVGGVANNQANLGGAGVYDLTAAGTITVGAGGVNSALSNGVPQTGATTLTTTGAGHNIAIGANNVGNLASATTLTSAGNITGTSGVVIGTAVTLSAAGDIGAGEPNPLRVDAGTLNFNSPGAVTISESNDTVLTGANTAGSLTLISTGSITDAPATSVNVAGDAIFFAPSITLADNGGDALTVGGQALFNSGALLNSGPISVGLGGAANFGTLRFTSTGGLVSIHESSDTVLDGGNNAETLVLSSTGSITNANFGSLRVGNASLSGTSIDLGNAPVDDVHLNLLTFNSPGAVNISADSAIVLSGTSTAGSLNLRAEGNLSNAAAMNLSVATTASFTGTQITLADHATDVLSVGTDASFHATTSSLSVGTAGTANFGTLNFSSFLGATIHESSDTVLTGANTAPSLDLSSTGSITNLPGAALDVAGNASFTGASINLGNNAGDTTNFGSLTFNSPTGAVSIHENSDTVLTGTSRANTLSLASDGSITDEAGISLVVTNNASFSGSSITLGKTNLGLHDGIDLGSLTFNSPGAVFVHEASAMVLSGASKADSLTLIGNGSITNEALAKLDVTNNANLSSDIITLGNHAGDEIKLGTLTFNATGDVSISQASDMVLTGANTALNLTLSSTGTITDEAGTHLTVGNGTVGDASITGTSIALADNATDRLEVTGNASFKATTGGITIGDAGFANFGSLTFNSPGAVVIQEDCCMLIAGNNTANSLNLTSSEGITNTDHATIDVTGNASFKGTSITLANNATNALSIGGNASFTATTGEVSVGTGNVANFGSLTFSGGAVTIAEGSATQLASANTASSLSLTSGGAITEAAGATLSVTNNASFAAGSNAITLTNAGANNFGNLTFNTTGAVAISEASDTVLSGTSTAGSLTLASTGTITQTGPLVVTGTGSISAGGNAITLTNAANNFGGLLNVTGGTVKITDANALAVQLSTGETYLISSGDLTVGGTAGNLTAVTNGGTVIWNNLTGTNVVLIAATPSVGAGGITGLNPATGDLLPLNTSFSNRGDARGTNLVASGELYIVARDIPGAPVDSSAKAKTAVLDVSKLNPENRLLLVLDAPNGKLRLLVDQGAFRFRAGSEFPGGVTVPDPKKVQVFVGNQNVDATVDAAFSAVSAAKQSALSSTSSDARQSFGTDSVTQQIDMGFAGDVGIAPTMAHNVPLQGEIISTPEGVTESKGGQ